MDASFLSVVYGYFCNSIITEIEFLRKSEGKIGGKV